MRDTRPYSAVVTRICGVAFHRNVVEHENESLEQDTLNQRADVFHRWHRITLNELTSLQIEE